MTFTKPLLAAVVLLLSGGAAHAKPSLSDVPEIYTPLMQIAIADEIDKHCNSLKGRKLKAIQIMFGLRSKANDLGYSDGEIKEWTKSKPAKAQARAQGEAYLKANGVDYEKPETFCALGRTEMKKKSAIGVLLKAN